MKLQSFLITSQIQILLTLQGDFCAFPTCISEVERHWLFKTSPNCSFSILSALLALWEQGAHLSTTQSTLYSAVANMQLGHQYQHQASRAPHCSWAHSAAGFWFTNSHKSSRFCWFFLLAHSLWYTNLNEQKKWGMEGIVNELILNSSYMEIFKCIFEE